MKITFYHGPFISDLYDDFSVKIGVDWYTVKNQPWKAFVLTFYFVNHLFMITFINDAKIYNKTIKERLERAELYKKKRDERLEAYRKKNQEIK